MPDPESVVATPSGTDATLVTPRWGIPDAAVGWFVALLAGIMSASVVYGITGDEFEDQSLAWKAIGNVGLWLAFLLVPVVVTRLKGNGPVVDLGLRFTWSDLPIGAAIGVATQIILVPLLYLPILWLSDYTSEDLSEPAEKLTDGANDVFGVVVLVIIVGVCAPIFEEIFYRGLFQRALQRRLGSGLAVGITAVIFGLSHFQPLQAPGLIVFGLVVGMLALRTGRLGRSIAAHVAFNLVTVVALVAAG